MFVLPSLANRDRVNEDMLMRLGSEKLKLIEECDTIINLADYEVRLIKSEGTIEHLGIKLFNDEVKENTDKEMLDFIETAVLAKLLDTDIEGNTDFLFFGGDISSLKNISQEIPCKISNLNSRFLSFEWTTENNHILRMDVPLSYINAKRENRGNIEERFIRKIKTSNSKRSSVCNLESNSLQPYGKGLFVLPGKYYLKEEINRNLYFSNDSTHQPLMSPKYPIESISNLLIYPSGFDKRINVEVTVLKHEIGEKEIFVTSLENLLAVCEADGCLPYWGVEEFNEGHLTGSLFLYNWKQGYNHVLKIECIPNEVIRGKGNIKARTSLFIPTNNIQTLFDPDNE